MEAARSWKRCIKNRRSPSGQTVELFRFLRGKNGLNRVYGSSRARSRFPIDLRDHKREYRMTNQSWLSRLKKTVTADVPSEPVCGFLRELSTTDLGLVAGGMRMAATSISMSASRSGGSADDSADGGGDDSF